MKSKLKFLFLALLAAQASAYEADKEYAFTILHVNDTHGHFWKNAHDEGGFAAQKTLIDKIRKEVAEKGGSTIVLHAGDYNSGTPESDLQKAKPDIEGMNSIGFDAVALGNHEFDNNLELLVEQEEWFKVPVLSANIVEKATQKPIAKPYVTLDKGGLKIAVVGLTTEDTIKIGNPDYIDVVKFRNSQEVAKEVIAALDANEKPDVKLALTHLGWYPDGKHGLNAPGDVSLARSLQEGVFTAIIGGHTHDTICMNDDGTFNDKYQPTEPCKPDFQNGTWILQAGEWGKYVGRADFVFKNGKAELKHYELIPVNLKKRIKTINGKTEYHLYQEEIAEDAELKEHLQKYQEEGDKLLGVKVGELVGDLDGERDHVRFFQTNLGRLIATVQKERVHADIGIVNSGGVRTSLNAGDITYRDILTVQPFANMVGFVNLQGQELVDYLTAVALKEVDMGAYAQFSGISMVVNRANKTISDVKIGGQPLDMNKSYRISLPDYCAGGGDGYPPMKKHPNYVNSGFVDAEVLKDFFSKKSPVNAADFAVPKDEIIYK